MVITRPQISKRILCCFVLLCCSCWRLACFFCFLAGLVVAFCFFLVGSLFFEVFLPLKVASKNTKNTFTQCVKAFCQSGGLTLARPCEGATIDKLWSAASEVSFLSWARVDDPRPSRFGQNERIVRDSGSLSPLLFSGGFLRHCSLVLILTVVRAPLSRVIRASPSCQVVLSRRP